MTASSPKARVAFKDRDVRRLIKAARAEGLNPTAVEVDVKAGRIRVISGNSNDSGGDLDKWLEGHP
jgi:hypothetical protein